MKLERYLIEKKMSVAQAAVELGCSRQRLYQIISGTDPAGRKLAVKINTWSEGQIDIASLITDDTEVEGG